MQQLVHHLAGFGIANDGAHRHFEGDVVALGAKHVGALAVLATLGIVFARVAEVDQGVEAVVGQGIHVPAAPAVATIGATELFVFFVSERRAAIAPVASGDFDIGFINKLHDCYCP